MEALLSQKKILITGGTSGLGRVFVRKALRQGAQVWATYYQDQVSADALSSEGARMIRLDLKSVPAMEELAKTLRAEGLKLDVLIHNAAAVRDHTLINMTEEEWDEVMAVNLKAPYYLTKKLLPLLFPPKTEKEPKPRKIFMMISRAAVQGGFGMANYAAAKAGLVGLVKSLAQELGKRRILVNAVNPGFMLSKMTRDLPAVVLEQNRLVSPLEQFSDPEQAADFLVYASSDRMAQVTGQILHWESRKI